MPVILIIIGVLIIVYNYKAIKKEETSTSAPNNVSSFQNLLDDSKEDLDEYKLELGVLRRDIAESLTELQSEIIEIKNILNIPVKEEDAFLDINKKNVEENINLNDNIKKSIINKDDVSEEVQISENEFLINGDFESDVISDIDFSKNNHDISNNTKTDNIKNLISEGFSDEEICHALNVSKGEVLLVRGLFKK